MGKPELQRRIAQIDLLAVLLLVVVLELALNRLAVPVLRPAADTPPGWHRNLDLAGLFLFHLASVMGLGVLLYKAWDLFVRRSLFAPPAAYTLLGVGVIFAGVAAWSVFGRPPPGIGFHVETAFVAFLLLLLLANAVRRGDPWTKGGLLLLCIPFFVHYYGTFTLSVLYTDEAMAWSLPDRVRQIGNLSLAGAALFSPYFFTPRPAARAFARPGPVALAVFVGTVGIVIMRRYYDVGMELAARGLGVELGPGAPFAAIALYVLALASVTWTLAATLTADSSGRRTIGLGLALVVSSGYAFTWPLQLLTAAAGALAIVQGGSRVREDEARAESVQRRFTTPPVEPGVWSQYVQQVSARLGTNAPVVDQDGPQETTVLRVPTERLEVRFEREKGGLAAIEIRVGAPPEGAEPVWTLAARPERLRAIGAHPAPPPTHAPATKTGDEAFDKRFKLRDAGPWTDKLLDDGLRARASAILDGWIALWRDGALVYRVHPGRGAPLDHPVPITEMAFRSNVEPGSADKIASVVELLRELASRVRA